MLTKILPSKGMFVVLRFRDWRAFAARLLFVAVGAVMLGAFAVPSMAQARAAEPAPVGAANEPRRDRDLALYDAIVARVAGGESYYTAAFAEQRARSFPVRPGFALRLPTLATIQAALGPVGTTVAAFALLLAIGLAWWRRFGDEGASASQRRFATALVLLGSSFLLNATYHPLHELWAGGLIALALGLHRPGKWTAALGVAALALAIRELVLPFVLLMGALAAWRRDWRETSAWCALVAGFVVLLGWHFAIVAQYQRAGDLAGPSWLVLRGLEGWIGNVTQSSQLHLLPGPIAILVPVLALVGWASRRTPSGITATLLLLGYGLAFMIAGRENNFYWGLIVTPILFAGLAFVPAALRNLRQGAARGLRPA